MKNLLYWINNNKKEFYYLVSLFFLSSFLRFYRISEYLPFLGDEGRDVRVVARFLKEFDLMFIGPRTSIGDMYLGPLYYYLISPFLWLWNFSPTGPAVCVGVIGVLTVFLVWYVARDWFGKIAGIVSAFLYTISPIVISFSKHSWNPNIMPFFALLCIYSLWNVWKKKKFAWLLVSGISFAFVAQSHYLGLLLLPTLGIIWLISAVSLHQGKYFSKFLLYSLLSLLLFILLMSPLFLFDLKHGWQNFEALKIFFIERQTTVSVKPWNAFPLLWPLWSENMIERILVSQKLNFNLWLSISLAGLFFWAGYFWKKRKEKYKISAHFILCIWVLSGLLGLGLLKQNIYDHYFGFMFTVPFLLIGAICQFLWEKKYKWLIVVIILFLSWFNLQNNPLKYPPQRQMQRVIEIDKKIIQEGQGKPFNFGLIAKRNYEEGYLYFFEQQKTQIREIDPQNMTETLTSQLFVVCEDLVCEPINNPKAEIANFGWAKIEQEWEIEGYKLFKLIHRI